ncbi:MAG: type II secretion system F family protein [Firmicutes bacterium]|nr:type II secretion system F family protein [Candidatus Fermentithermobacillaceae bacterium]
MRAVVLFSALAFGGCAALLCYDVGVNLLRWRLPKVLADSTGSAPRRGRGTSLLRVLRRLGRQEDLLSQVEEIALGLGFQLKAGANVYQAVAEVARQGRGTAYSALGRAVDLYGTGLPIADALTEALSVPGYPELEYLLSVLVMGLRTGGNIPVLLARAAEACRRKRAFRKEAGAKLAESRLTAVLVSVLPWMIFLITWRMQPDMLLKLFSQPAGRTIAAISLLMWILGVGVVGLLLKSVAPGGYGLGRAGAQSHRESQNVTGQRRG